MRSRSRSGALLLALALVLMPAAPAFADDAAPSAAEPAEPAPVETPDAPVEKTPPPEAPADKTAEPEPAPTPTPTPSPTPSTPPVEEAPAGDEPIDGLRKIDDAELRWGLTDESNNMSHAPGRFNFFSAGRIPDPRGGGHTVTRSEWTQRSGNVAIEKSNGSAYAPATFDGLRTNATGEPIRSASSGSFSDHQFVFSGGTGEMDSAEGDATISWKGAVTVIYYSGYTFFYLSDPTLTVEDGVGTVTATLDGYASSQDDLGVWGPVEPRIVTVAELGAVKVDGRGFTIEPEYLGRRVSGAGQVGPGQSDSWGAFPQSFVNFHVESGAAGFWVATGSAFDRLKVPLPMTVSYDAGDAIVPPTPEVSTGTDDEVTNNVLAPPSIPAPQALAAPSSLAPPAVSVPVAAAAPALAPSGATFQQVAATTVLSAADEAAQAASAALWWWLGAALMTLAAASVAGTFAYSAAVRPRS